MYGERSGKSYHGLPAGRFVCRFNPDARNWTVLPVEPKVQGKSTPIVITE